MDIFARIQDDKGQFSQSERRIADILVSDFEFAVNASIIELAARAEVSPPTVTRFCRRLGCQSFSDFKVSLAKTAYVGVRYLTSEPSSTGPSDVAEEVLAKAQEALFLLHKTLDPALADEAAVKIANSGMIYAFGAGGNSSMIASEIQNRLFRLGLRVSTSADHSMQLMMTAAARKEDVIIGSSFSGRNMELVKCFRLAREMGSPPSRLPRATCLSLPRPIWWWPLMCPKGTISSALPHHVTPIWPPSIFLRRSLPISSGRDRW